MSTGGGRGQQSGRAHPRRVEGGTVLGVRPGKRRRKRNRPPVGAVRAPAILSAAPTARGTKSRGEPEEDGPAAGDEFDGLLDDDLASESDALLVLRSYTSPPSGSCGLCPILRPKEGAGSTVECVPFLTRRVLLRLLTAGPSPSAAGAEAEVREMLRDGRAVGIQLLGTADGGDGNDPDDVTVVEAGSYLHAAGRALAHSRAGREGRGATASSGNGGTVDWIGESLIPALRGRPYLPSDELERLDCSRVEELLGAGLLTPRPVDIGGGCRLSLPGLGRCSRSVSACRASILQRLGAARYREVRRSRLEEDSGRRRKKKDSGIFEQSGRFAVLDMLSIGAVEIRTLTEGGDQFVRLVDEGAL